MSADSTCAEAAPAEVAALAAEAAPAAETAAKAAPAAETAAEAAPVEVVMFEDIAAAMGALAVEGASEA